MEYLRKGQVTREIVREEGRRYCHCCLAVLLYMFLGCCLYDITDITETTECISLYGCTGVCYVTAVLLFNIIDKIQRGQNILLLLYCWCCVVHAICCVLLYHYFRSFEKERGGRGVACTPTMPPTTPTTPPTKPFTTSSSSRVALIFMVLNAVIRCLSVPCVHHRRRCRLVLFIVQGERVRANIGKLQVRGHQWEAGGGGGGRGWCSDRQHHIDPCLARSFRTKNTN